MSLFDFESKSFFDGFYEIEEGVYLKHYGIEIPFHETAKDADEINSFGDFEVKSLLWQKQIDMHSESVAPKSIITDSLCGFTLSQFDAVKEGATRDALWPSTSLLTLIWQNLPGTK